MSQEEDSPVAEFESSDEHEINQKSPESVSTGTLPLFRVVVTEASKDGPQLQFAVMATQVDGDRGSVVTRQFEDIEWLHHQLVTKNSTAGIIIPPLPCRPEYDPKSAESKTKKQLGPDCNILKPDDFEYDCKGIQKYLSSMLLHPSFGRDKNLEQFLTEKEPPVRAKVSKGIIGWISTTIDSARKGQHKDIDDYFGKQREWTTEFSKLAKEASQNFNKLTQSQWRLTTSCHQFASALSATKSSDTVDSATKINKLMLILSDGIESLRKSLEALSQKDETLLGFELDLLNRNMESVKEMLFQRTCLLVDYEDCSRALEKAKPPKKSIAEEAKRTAELAYENCTENARRELKTFMRQRVLSMQEGLTAFAEAQIRSSRETYTILLNTRNAINGL